MINTIFLLSLFPFFKIIPFITAEVQPVASLFAGIYLVKFKKKTFPKFPVFFYLLVILLYFCIAFFQTILNPYNEDLIYYALESALIFISPLLIFLALFDNLHFISANIFKFALYSWLYISILQNYFSGILSAIGINFVLSLLISRFSNESLGGSRGVAGFAPEPSYAAHVIVLMFAFSIFLYRSRKILKKECYFMVFSCLFMAYVNRSASVVLFFFIFLIFYISKFRIISINQKIITSTSRKVNKKATISLILLLCTLIGVYCLPTIILTFLPNSRIADFLLAFSSLNYQHFNFFDLLDLTNNLGSQRQISVYVGYFNIFETYGLGSGLGSWGTNFLDTLEKAGINPSEINFFIYNGLRNLKPYAYAALLSFDTGIVGLVPLSMIFISSFLRKLHLNRKLSQYSWACLGLSMFLLYFNSVVSLPTSWLMFLLSLQDKHYSINSNEDVNKYTNLLH
ncbi:hypothetical protein HW132_25905 [Brasilonema sp. CT11]|nr:hypothetical protein [Brasilonema sp. CT11]